MSDGPAWLGWQRPPLRQPARAERAMLRRARERQRVVLALLIAALLLVAGRVAYWQLTEHARLSAWADAEHLRVEQLPAGRGCIVASDGTILAVSVTADAVIADPTVIRQVGALAAEAALLGQLAGLPAASVLAQLDVPGQYAELHASDGQAILLTPSQESQARQAIAAGQLAGVSLYPQVVREYPSGTLAAQVLGFARASDGSGQYGIEQGENAVLAGTPGTLATAVDAAGQPLATVPQRETPAVAGQSVTLTLDATVQYWAEQGLAATVRQMGATGGTVIVEDPTTGAIIAMASLPSFDPNSYGQAPLASLANPAVSAVYDPGSVMKAVTMAAGIQTGTITPDTSFYDTGSTAVDGTTLYNFNRMGHGWETMTQVLQYSANVGAVWVEQQLGAARFEHYVRAFGFGQATGVALPGEVPGLMPQAASPGEAQLNAAENAFGESIGVTPLQMVMAYGALANGGLLLRPTIVAGTSQTCGAATATPAAPRVVRRVVSAATAATVTQMLVESARYSDAEMWRVGGYAVAAKTGTATPDPRNPSRTYASVLGYAPASHPRFVLLVKLDYPRTSIFGGAAAGPLWRALAEQLLAYYHIPPSAG